MTIGGCNPTEAPFDVNEFLARPLVARVATNGPTVRPVWFLWEESAFWWLTGPWSSLPVLLEEDPSVALIVDSCDLATGEVRQVRAWGKAGVVPLDPERAHRKLVRYLGPDESAWDPRFRSHGDMRMVHLRPERLEVRDLSYEASAD